MPKVPGSFKSPPGTLTRDSSPQGAGAERLVLAAGALYAVRYTLRDCTVMVSRDPMRVPTVTLGEWDEKMIWRWHLSIAHPSRYPTWDEIKTARYTAPELVDVPLMAQLLPKLEDEGDWVNVHENAMHLHEIIDKEVRND